ncbi:MAG: hypothetical protein EOM12_07005 [Verrucomicrobiae bacterium]|nr:hypothetical protein [Verrucomicrobiae bacterium]
MKNEAKIFVCLIALCMVAGTISAATYTAHLDSDLTDIAVSNIIVMKERLTNYNDEVRANLDLYVEGLQGVISEDQTSMIKEIAMHGIDGLADGFNYWNIKSAQLVYYNQSGDVEKLLEWANADRGVVAAAATGCLGHLPHNPKIEQFLIKRFKNNVSYPEKESWKISYGSICASICISLIPYLSENVVIQIQEETAYSKMSDIMKINIFYNFLSKLENNHCALSGWLMDQFMAEQTPANLGMILTEAKANPEFHDILIQAKEVSLNQLLEVLKINSSGE